MSAGDLQRNLATIITEYMSSLKEDLKIATRLSAIASRCWTLYFMATDTVFFSKECELVLGHYCVANRLAIVRLYPSLGEPMTEFVDGIAQPDDKHNTWCYERNVTFVRELTRALEI